MRSVFRLIPALLAFAFVAASLHVQAQPAGAVQALTPITRDLGSIKTFTAFASTSTVQASADQNGYNVSRVLCVYNQASGANTPSTQFGLQNKDAASGQYYTLINSAAITATAANTLNFLSLGAGNASSANSSPLPVAKTWRVVATVGGAGTVTGTIGCSVQ